MYIYVYIYTYIYTYTYLCTHIQIDMHRLMLRDNCWYYLLPCVLCSHVDIYKLRIAGY